MGGKGGSSGPSTDQINQQAYAAGAGGQKWNDITGQIPYGHDAALQSWLSGQKSAQRQQSFEMPEFAMPEFAMPEMPDQSQALAQQQSQFETQMQQQKEAAAQAEAERRRIEGTNKRDALYSQYMDAAGTATDFINQQINDEMSNARLLGIDYQMDDEMKSQRIGDYFASIWGEGQQSQLEALMGQWGNPSGFDGFTISRGDAGKVKGGQAGEQQISAGKGQKPKLLIEEDEEQLLGGAGTILGA